ncbi:MAG: DinB family protein [Anaerolineales bacterium]|nr:DinB family protein [Anaerolineales bacterium]
MEESRQSLLEDYKRLPERLEAVIAGLGESDLDLRLESGWLIRQYICHLVEGEQLWQINLRMIIGLNGANFPFTWYPEHSQIEWAELWAYDKRCLQVMLDQYRADTQYLIDILKNLPDAVWKHYGRITWLGDEVESQYSVRDIVEMHLRHLDGHAEDIRAIRALHGC